MQNLLNTLSALNARLEVRDGKLHVNAPAGVLTPELRVIACRSENELPDAILAELETWGAFEKIDVYDEADKPMFSFTAGPNPAH